MAARALCVAIFDKKDVLLYLKVKEKGIDLDTSMEIQRFLHNSYDIVLDKINNPAGKTTQDLFLGSLLLNTQFRSHGYLTNTGTKLLLITDAENSVLKDHEVRLFFKKLHSKYCNALANPFYKIGTTLRNRQIDDTVQDFFDCF